MFRIKICGVTSVQDALHCAAAGADAIGLNFFAQSPRFVSTQVARSISASLGDSVAKVGVFVNKPTDEIRAIVEEVGLDAVQLHGDEPTLAIRALSGVPVLRAWRLSSANHTALLDYMDECRRQDSFPAGWLIDAWAPGIYGGSGATAPWGAIKPVREHLGTASLILAGGLNPDNVSTAITSVRPDAVDVASGVEASPGKKDPDKVLRFVERALDAWRSCEG